MNRFLPVLLSFFEAPDYASALAAAIGRGMAELREHCRRSIVPRTVGSFAEVHDWVDANAYGGAFQFPFSGNRDDAYLDAEASFWNAVQDGMDRRIRRGELLHKGK